MTKAEAKLQGIAKARKEIQGNFNVVKPHSTDFIKKQLEDSSKEHWTSTKELQNRYISMCGAKLLNSEITAAIDWLRLNEVSEHGFIIAKYKKGYKYTQRENMIKAFTEAKLLLNKKNSVIVTNALQWIHDKETDKCNMCGKLEYKEDMIRGMCLVCESQEGDQQMGYFGDGDE